MSTVGDGTADYYRAAALPMTALVNITLMCWVYYDSTSEKGRIIMIGQGSTDGYGFAIGSGNDGVSGNEVLVVYDGVAWLDPNTNAGTGWHHIALTRDNVATPVTRIFLDGTVLGTTFTTVPVTPVVNTTILASYVSSTPSQFLTLVNRVALIKVFNTDLSANQIVTEMNSYDPVFHTNLVWFAPCDEGTGTTILDYTQKFTTNLDGVSSPVWADGPPVTKS